MEVWGSGTAGDGGQVLARRHVELSEPFGGFQVESEARMAAVRIVHRIQGEGRGFLRQAGDPQTGLARDHQERVILGQLTRPGGDRPVERALDPQEIELLERDGRARGVFELVTIGLQPLDETDSERTVDRLTPVVDEL